MLPLRWNTSRRLYLRLNIAILYFYSAAQTSINNSFATALFQLSIFTITLQQQIVTQTKYPADGLKSFLVER